jgi:sterol 3beta-glucosyltransferase
MRIAVVANDTRGGVQPYLALAIGLKASGHSVKCVAPKEFQPIFEAHQLPFHPLSVDAEQARGATRIAEMGIAASMRFVAKELPVHLATWTREALAGCEGVDCITGGVGGMVVALGVSDKLKVPFVETHLQPIAAPTDVYPGVLVAGLPIWRTALLRRMSHRFSDIGVWMPFKRAMLATRRNILELPDVSRATQGQPVLYGFSKHVVPLNMSGPRKCFVTGYWTLPTPKDYQPPPHMETFLQGGKPVISVGFGSMKSEEPAAVTALVVAAARQANVRLVLLSGWGGLDSTSNSSDVVAAESLPHDWLFKQVQGIVHHGGAGTTGAALISGTPATVVPFTMDQPFWASRVAALGTGAKAIPRKKISVQALADAMTQMVQSETIGRQAKAIGQLLQQEDGVAEAVKVFEELKLSR